LPQLRAWQNEALDKYFSAEHRDFTVTATPGAGKTTFALRLAQKLKQTGEINRVVVVVPTDHLRGQWASAAEGFGLTLHPSLDNSSSLPSHYSGYVTTYPQVARKPLLHASRTDFPKKTLVIFDEVHHAGEGLSWGEGIYHAFSHVTRRLSLTGTPFRTNENERIPFLKYREMEEMYESVADYTYSYQDALRDRVVRPVMFAAYSGVARWESDAEAASANLTGVDSHKEEMAAWRTVLSPKGKWVPHVLAAAAKRLDDIREQGKMPDAGMLVLASDQDSARAYAQILQKITGVAPVIALSDDPDSSEKISQFNRGFQKYLVAVRMVSEGVDVPRLGVLVWLTSYRTPLFFAQAIGRVVRSRGAHESATVFLPAVRPLLSLATDLEQQRKHILPKINSIDEMDELTVELNDQPEDEATSNGFRALASEASFAHVLYSGKSVVPEYSEDELDSLGLFAHAPELLSPAETAALLAKNDNLHKKKSEELSLFEEESAGTELPSAKTHEDLLSLRREINMLVNRIAVRTGFTQVDAHLAARKNFPGPPNAEADFAILESRRDWLMSKLS
jgi:superfamily II DNA or RNA helicase